MGAALSASAQSDALRHGHLLVRHVSEEEYQAHRQNWAIEQAPNGLLYVANTTAVLEYDGVTWRSILMQAGTMSLAVGRDGRVWVGGQNEVGYLEPDSLGRNRFVGIEHHLDEEQRQFGPVWRIARDSANVYFQAARQIMRWDGTALSVTASSGRIFEVGDWVAVTNPGDGLMRAVGDSAMALPGGDFLRGHNVVAIIPFGDSSWLIVTRTEALFEFDGEEVRPVSMPVQEWLEVGVYRAITLIDGSMAFATDRAGVIITDPAGRVIHYLDKENGGLRNDGALGLGTEMGGALWIGQESGLTRVAWPAPLTIFDARNGLDEASQAMEIVDGRMFVASNESGLRRMAITDGALYPQFEPIDGVEGMWSVLRDGSSLLVSSHAGTFEIRDPAGPPIPVDADRSVTHRVTYRLRSDTTRYLIGRSDGLRMVRREGDSWIAEGPVSDIPSEVRTIAETRDGHLFVATDYDGVYRVPYEAPESRYGAGERLMIEGDTLLGQGFHVFDEGDRIYLTNSAQRILPHVLFRYDEDAGEFVTATEMDPRFLQRERTVYRLEADASGNLWIRSKLADVSPEDPSGESGVALRRPDGTFYWYTSPFAPVQTESTVLDFHLEGDSLAWFLTRTQIVRYDRAADDTTRYSASFGTRIRSVRLGGDSLLFGGGHTPGWTAPHLAHDQNSFRFEYAAMSFAMPEANRYQVRLDGLDRDWSGWTSETRKDYTSLPPGRYTFRVRARNAFGIVGDEDAFVFRIGSPWYATWWAFTLYGLLGLGTLVPAIRYVSYRRLQQQLRELETERRVQRERERISRDLHDHVGAQLSSMISGIELIHLSARAGDVERSEAYLRALNEDARASIEQLRETIWALHKEHVTLGDLRDQFQRFLERQMRYRERPVLSCRVVAGDGVELSSMQALHLFRIGQEAVNNSLKYAGADQVRIELGATAAAVRMTIEDDGTFRPFEPGEGRVEGFGLRNMRRRAEELGGTFELSHEAGTVVHVEIPLVGAGEPGNTLFR